MTKHLIAVSMSWPSFLSPMWGLLGLLAIPLILLYVLRQKRPEVAISSTVLWYQTLADMRASTPFQKLRRNLLLLLQLLVLGGLVVTLMRPVIQAQAQKSVAGVIVMDASASMQTTDVEGKSRLEAAKAQAHSLVDSMRTGDRYMLLADGGGVSQVRSGFLPSKADLHRLINQVGPADTTSDLSETLLLAASSLRAIAPAGASPAAKTEALEAGKIWFFSDGVGISLPRVPEMERLLKYVRLGESSNNVGIVRVAVTPVAKEPGNYEVFAGLVNASKQSRSVVVGLAYGQPDKFIATTHVTLGAGQQGGALFEKVASAPGKVFIQLDGKDDDFALDNTAYALIEAPRKIRVIAVSAGNELLKNFLSTAAGLGELEGGFIDPASYNAKMPADLVIFDNVAPKELPSCDALFIRPPASVEGFKVVGQLQRPAILRWQRDDPVLAYVELADVHISTALKLERDPELHDLIVSTQGPLLVQRDAGSARRYLLGFDPWRESDLWQQPAALPIFFENIIQQTRARHFIGSPQVLATGTAAKLWDLQNPSTLTLPTGGDLELHPQDGAVEFPATDHVGFYEVHSGNKQAVFAANLFSATASNIAPKSLELATGENVEEAASVALVNREIWPWFAVAALVLLMVEWWVYHWRIA